MNSDVLAQLLEQLYSPAIELHKKRQIQFEKNMLKYYFFPNLLNSQLGSMFKALLIRVGRMWEKGSVALQSSCWVSQQLFANNDCLDLFDPFWFLASLPFLKVQFLGEFSASNQVDHSMLNRLGMTLSRHPTGWVWAQRI